MLGFRLPHSGSPAAVQLAGDVSFDLEGCAAKRGGGLAVNKRHARVKWRAWQTCFTGRQALLPASSRFGSYGAMSTTLTTANQLSKSFHCCLRALSGCWHGFSDHGLLSREWPRSMPGHVSKEFNNLISSVRQSTSALVPLADIWWQGKIRRNHHQTWQNSQWAGIFRPWHCSRRWAWRSCCQRQIRPAITAVRMGASQNSHSCEM